MTEAITNMTAPDKNGKPTLPKRGGPKGLLPSTWLDRTLRIEYTDCHGTGQEISGVLLDFFPAGPVLNAGGARTLIAWETVAMIELVED